MNSGLVVAHRLFVLAASMKSGRVLRPNSALVVRVYLPTKRNLLAVNDHKLNVVCWLTKVGAVINFSAGCRLTKDAGVYSLGALHAGGRWHLAYKVTRGIVVDVGLGGHVHYVLVVQCFCDDSIPTLFVAAVLPRGSASLGVGYVLQGSQSLRTGSATLKQAHDLAAHRRPANVVLSIGVFQGNGLGNNQLLVLGQCLEGRGELLQPCRVPGLHHLEQDFGDGPSSGTILLQVCGLAVADSRDTFTRGFVDLELGGFVAFVPLTEVPLNDQVKVAHHLRATIRHGSGGRLFAGDLGRTGVLDPLAQRAQRDIFRGSGHYLSPFFLAEAIFRLAGRSSLVTFGGLESPFFSSWRSTRSSFSLSSSSSDSFLAFSLSLAVRCRMAKPPNSFRSCLAVRSSMSSPTSSCDIRLPEIS